jgi:hypothetical protein
MNVQPVAPKYIHQVWPDVVGFVEDALQYGAGEYNADQMKVMILRGEQDLLVAVEENAIKGAATVQFIDYPNCRVAYVTSIGGKLIANKDTFKELTDWCKFNGATKIQGAARESVERLWKRLFNFERRYVIVEREL